MGTTEVEITVCTDADVREQLNSDVIASCVRTFLVQAQVAGRLEDTLMVDLSRMMDGILR